jgi:hypothetical protein
MNRVTKRRLRAFPGSTSWLGVVALALISTACGGGRSGSTGNPDVIGREELVEFERLTALELVQRRRPQWLRPRGVDSFYSSNDVVVYVDQTRVGGIDQLDRLSSSQLAEIRFLDSREATTRFGSGHVSGAIMVTTLRGPG